MRLKKLGLWRVLTIQMGRWAQSKTPGKILFLIIGLAGVEPLGAFKAGSKVWVMSMGSLKVAMYREAHPRLARLIGECK